MLEDLFKTLKSLFFRFETKEENLIRTNKILSAYKIQRPLYESFASIMRKLIDELLTQGGYKYQISVRVKNDYRLEEKIKRKYLLGKSYKKLSDIEDLVGIRIIFYTESDKEDFIKDLKKEITGQLDLQEIKKESGYAATHIITGLGPKRLRLVEYRPFGGLKCEIQITSALYHAWAELEHDIIYKDIDKFGDFDPANHEFIKNKLKEILEKHIRKATEEFEKIKEQINNP